MGRWLRSPFLGAIPPIGGLVVGFDWVTVTLPIYVGWLHADYGDPDHPGHLKGVIVTPLEFWIKTLAILVLAALTVYMWRCRVGWRKDHPG